MRLVLCVLLCMVGCYRPSITPTETLAVRSAVDGWTEVISAPDEHACHIDLTTVIHATAARFERACRIKPGPGGAAACLLYESVGFKRSAPRIYLRPGLTEAEVVDVVIHESLHNLVECELKRIDPWDPFDARHQRPNVWEAAGGANSAQARARARARSLAPEVER